MKKIILSAILLAGGSPAITLDDVPYDTTMWSALDPFGFATLRTTAPSNWVNSVISAHGTNTAVHANKIEASAFTATNAAVWSAIVDLAVRKTAWNEAYDFIATGTAGIANNSNRINTANANIAIVSNGVVSANSSIIANSNLTVSALSVKVGTNDATYTATVARAASALQPVDTNGWTVSAHEAWITNETDSIALGVMATQRITRLYGADSWQTLENGTATTYRVTYPINGYRLEAFESPSYLGVAPTSSVYLISRTWGYTGMSYGWIANADLGNNLTFAYQSPLATTISYMGGETPVDEVWQPDSVMTFPVTFSAYAEGSTGYWMLTEANVTPVTNTYFTATTDMQFGVSASQVTNIVDAVKELHVDSYTNLIWRSVYSNGWMWLVAYTNYPAN